MEYLWKFNPQSNYTPKEGDKLYDVHQKAIKGLPLTKEEKEYITRQIICCSYRGTSARFLGWNFDFSPILHKILVHYDCDGYGVFYAINKTYIKKQLANVKEMTYIDCDGKVNKPYD